MVRSQDHTQGLHRTLAEEPESIGFGMPDLILCLEAQRAGSPAAALPWRPWCPARMTGQHILARRRRLLLAPLPPSCAFMPAICSSAHRPILRPSARVCIPQVSAHYAERVGTRRAAAAREVLRAHQSTAEALDMTEHLNKQGYLVDAPDIVDGRGCSRHPRCPGHTESLCTARPTSWATARWCV